MSAEGTDNGNYLARKSRMTFAEAMDRSAQLREKALLAIATRVPEEDRQRAIRAYIDFNPWELGLRMSKTTALTPEEWKQLCLLNVIQLKGFLDQLAVPVDEQVALIDEHLARFKMFLNAWVKSRTVEEKVPERALAQEMNGAEPPKKKRGRPRKDEGKIRPTEAGSVQ